MSYFVQEAAKYGQSVIHILKGLHRSVCSTWVMGESGRLAMQATVGALGWIST